MNRIDDLTDEQIRDLTDDDLDRLVKYRMAEEGIPILPMPIEPDYQSAVPPDVPIYNVAGVDFSSRDDAEAVMQAVNDRATTRVETDYDYAIGYNVRFVKDASDKLAQVTTSQVYSQTAYALNKNTLRANAEIKKTYDAEMRAYNDSQRASQKIRDEIHGRHQEVQDRFRRLGVLVDRFREYVQIASGDELMALQFLLKAYNLDDEEIAYVKSAGEPS